MPLTDNSSCHHCHIHAPIAPQELKRTHPLRSGSSASSVAPAPDSSPNQNGQRWQEVEASKGFRKNVSFLYRKIQKRNKANNNNNNVKPNIIIPPPPPLPPPRLPESPQRSSTPSTPVDRRPSVVVDCQPSRNPQDSPQPLPLVNRRRGHKGLAGLQAAILIGAYALLLVLAIVIGVVLSQDVRRGRFRPNIRGASPAPLRPGANVRITRPRFPSGNVRIGRPTQSAPRPPPPPPPPTTPRPPPTTTLPDYEYVYVDDDPVVLPNPIAPPREQVFVPRPAPPPTLAPRPSVAPRRPPPPQPPRRSNIPLASLDRDFSLQPEERVRGRKEPEVKILKSWSHMNADGTFSWGYINTDGSFKNETKGLDCVVNGVYGYVDKATGEQLSFPYTSGNPCDPDAPDYYYDYDTNTMVVRDGEDLLSRPGANPLPRRQG